ncbi:hypothetical protein DVH24_017471 [Malus domestica]|uniref:Prefoldin subunit 6 n=1 Tax=Malus domestica TaxID=3750 RepID=A0A498ISJ7_MALDO|nr:hypothetical protein DVH24_017471 [Malus domestica]
MLPIGPIVSGNGPYHTKPDLKPKNRKEKRETKPHALKKKKKKKAIAAKSMASSSAIRELQRELEAKANDLSKIQKGKSYTYIYIYELDLLSEDANVFKLIGPVLVKQDLAEARANVRKRIEYISAELKRLDATLQDLEEKQNSKKETIFKLQQRAQALQAGKAKA